MKHDKYYKAMVCDKEVLLARQRSVAIKAYCTDCAVGQRTEIKECSNKLCPLYPFRGYIKWKHASYFLPKRGYDRGNTKNFSEVV